MHWTVSLIHLQAYSFDEYPKSLLLQGIMNPPMKVIAVSSWDVSCPSLSGCHTSAVGEAIEPSPTLIVMFVRGRVGFRRSWVYITSLFIQFQRFDICKIRSGSLQRFFSVS